MRFDAIVMFKWKTAGEVPSLGVVLDELGLSPEQIDLGFGLIRTDPDDPIYMLSTTLEIAERISNRNTASIQVLGCARNRSLVDAGQGPSRRRERVRHR